MQVSRNFEGTFTLSVAFEALRYHATCSDSEYSTSNYMGIHWRQAQDGYLRGIEVSTWIPTAGAFQLQAEPDLAWPHDQRLVGSLNARATKLSRQSYGTWEWTWTRTGHLEFWLLNNALGDSAYRWKGVGYAVWWDGEYVILSYSSGSTGHTMLQLTVPSAQVPVGEEVSMTVTRTSTGLFTVSATYAGEVTFRGTAGDDSISTSNFLGIYWWDAAGGFVQKVRLCEWVATRGSFQMVPDSTWPQSLHLLGAEGTRAEKPSTQAFGTWEWSWTRAAHVEFWLTNTALDDSSFYGGIGYVLRWDGDFLKLTRSSGSTGLDLVVIHIAVTEVFLDAEVDVLVRRDFSGLFTVAATHSGRTHVGNASDINYVTSSTVSLCWRDGSGYLQRLRMTDAMG